MNLYVFISEFILYNYIFICIYIIILYKKHLISNDIIIYLYKNIPYFFKPVLFQTGYDPILNRFDRLHHSTRKTGSNPIRIRQKPVFSF